MKGEKEQKGWILEKPSNSLLVGWAVVRNDQLNNTIDYLL